MSQHVKKRRIPRLFSSAMFGGPFAYCCDRLRNHTFGLFAQIEKCANRVMVSIKDSLLNSAPIVHLRMKRKQRNVKQGLWVAGRVSCMGHKVLKSLNQYLPMLNVQKGRIDYFLDVAANPKLKARTEKVARFFRRRDIIPLIAEESSIDWLLTRQPSAFFMDSFSELTDQLFIHRRDGWRFCCHYSDLQHTPQFANRFETSGLLPVKDLLSNYRRFFKMVRQCWGMIPIVFMHCPASLDERVEFQRRYKNILESITEVSGEFQPFHSLIVDESLVGWPVSQEPGLENFPYHYNQRTYRAFAEQVRTSGVFEMLKARSK